MVIASLQPSKKGKVELVDEILRLKKELRARSDEVMMLKKRLSLYKSLDDR